MGTQRASSEGRTEFLCDVFDIAKKKASISFVTSVRPSVMHSLISIQP